MDFVDLALFREIALTRSLSRAAAKQKITQSAGSQRLQNIEKALHATLVNRQERPLTLTEAGEIFFRFCHTVLREQEKLTAALSHQQDEVEGEVNFVTIYSVGLSEVQGIRETFARKHPRATLKVEYMRPERIYQALVDGSADLGIVSYPQGTADVEVYSWREEEMVVAVAPTHPLAAFASVHPTQLQDLPFIAFDVDLPIQKSIDRYLRDQRVTVRRQLHLDNIDSIREVVEQGVGVAIVPKPILKSHVRDGRIVAIPLVPRGLKRPLGIVTRRAKVLSRTARCLLEILKDAGLPPQALRA